MELIHENALDAIGFEWDENKRKSNIIKHGIDFEDAKLLFVAPFMNFALKYTEESRWQATGVVGTICVAVIYTWRGKRIRMISARRARPDERRMYRALLDRRGP